MSDVSERAGLLRSLALDAVYQALGQATVRIYGPDPQTYSGAVIDDQNTVILRQVWTENEPETKETVTWQYETVATIYVRRKPVERKPW